MPSENSTWIIPSARLTMHAVEEGFGCEGLLSGGNEAVDVCKSGDRVLVHETVI